MDQKSHRLTLLSRIGQVDEGSFEALALEVFAYQAVANPLYAQYLQLLGIKPDDISGLDAIPFLPIGLFKKYKIQTGVWQPEQVFTSSGTTGMETSMHLLRDSAFYRRNARRAFEAQYGPLPGYCVLALLPAYLERSGSSLVFMAQDFIAQSGDADSGFFLNDMAGLLDVVRRKQDAGRRVLLLGVSFALLDLAEQYAPDLRGVVVMETGGMKGRRRELTRAELHKTLCGAFGVDAIHSEYGMTELLSQGYSAGQGIFQPAPTLRVRTREITDPLAPQLPEKNGAINIIDLANVDTISFVATDDLGRYYPDNSFEVIGRLDASDIRGCNLMVE